MPKLDAWHLVVLQLCVLDPWEWESLRAIGPTNPGEPPFGLVTQRNLRAASTWIVYLIRRARDNLNRTTKPCGSGHPQHLGVFIMLFNWIGVELLPRRLHSLRVRKARGSRHVTRHSKFPHTGWRLDLCFPDVIAASKTKTHPRRYISAALLRASTAPLERVETLLVNATHVQAPQ